MKYGGFLIQYGWCPYQKGEIWRYTHTPTHTYTQKTLCEHEDRDEGDASTGQGMPKIASKPAEARREAWN